MLKNRYGGVDLYAVKHVSFKARVLLRTPHFNKDDLEDLEQELMLAYLLAWTSFDPDKGNPKSFIKAVVNNRAAEMLREAEAQKRWTGLKTLSLSTPVTDDTDSTIGDQITSDESLWGDVFSAQSQSTAEQTMDAQKLLAQLPDDLRQTYRLLMEYSVTEAAELLGIPRTTMSSRLKKLKKFMGKIKESGTNLF
jgi:RNA polymerase sigma factor (sigma-70 family)